MKTLFLCLLILVAATSTSLGQSLSNKSRQSAVESKILQMEQSWMSAMKQRDETTLNRLVASEFTLSGADDLEQPPLPREAWIYNTMHNLKVESVSFEKTRVRLFGNTAVVQAIFTWKGVFKGEPFTDTVVLIDIWVRRNADWQVVSRFIGESKKPENVR